MGAVHEASASAGTALSWGIVAGAAVGLVGSALSADAQRSAGNKASDAQTRANEAAIAEQRRQFDAIQKLLSPYVTGGTAAFGAQQDLLGLSGAAKQQQAIQALESSPQFSAMAQQGENAILANASATGGLRGGNAQAALGQFRPQLLNQLITQQFERLGGLSSLGQNAAAGVGNAGMHSTDAITQLLQSQGAAQAGAALSSGRANSMFINGVANAAGNYFGAGGGNPFGSYTTPNWAGNYSNPGGETYDYRGAVMPNDLRGWG